MACKHCGKYRHEHYKDALGWPRFCRVDQSTPMYEEGMYDKQLPNETLTHAPQMSLRDWFAGQALASGECPYNSYEHEKRATWVYELSDAMLERRTK